jgi:hypothetical protein
MKRRTERRSDVSRDSQVPRLRRMRLSRLTSLLLVVVPIQGMAAGFLDLWLTPDQQGQRLYERGEYAEAADAFEDPARRAASYYRAGAVPLGLNS